MLRNCVVLVVLLGTAFCNVPDGGGLGGVVEDPDNGIPPHFQRALKMAYFNKKVISIVHTTKQVVAGVKYTVHFNAAPHTCFAGEKYIESNFCESRKESCIISYFVQAWKKKDLTLSSDSDANICQSNNYNQELKENAFNSTVDAYTRKLFDKFIAKYERTYRPDENNGKYWKRFFVFKKNLELAHKLNIQEQGTAQYGITKFMDYTFDEYKNYLAPGFIKAVKPPKVVDVTPVDEMPSSFDWTEHGAVTEVKNQGQCGSCWAFSTTGNVEGQWFLKKGQLVSLSEQELVDCDTVDQGCNGGLPSNAYLSIEKLGGLEREKDYSYDARHEKCQFKKSEVAVYINDSLALPTDEDKLAAWMYKNGPISIGINANAMMYYIGGISHPYKILCNPDNLDHGVLIVGYGVDSDGTKFWKIKNSWGANWGEEGYYRIYRGDGSCGLNRMATSSIVD